MATFKTQTPQLTAKLGLGQIQEDCCSRVQAFALNAVTMSSGAAEDDGEIRRLLATLAHERRRHDQLEVR